VGHIHGYRRHPEHCGVQIVYIAPVSGAVGVQVLWFAVVITVAAAHPVDGKDYVYKGDDVVPEDGVLDYVIYGELSTEGQCFIVANGSSFVGDCAADTTL